MTVFADMYPRRKPGFRYNAYFEYDGNRFDVNVTNLQYPWTLAMSGSSQARARQTNYPKRVEQGAITVSLQFRDPEEYLSFCEWIRGYHSAITRIGNPPRMKFASNANTHGPSWSYLVAIPSVKPSVTYNVSPAPEMANLKLELLRDELDLSDASPSQVYGGFEDLIGEKVTSGDIKNSGSGGAYSGSNNSSSSTRNHVSGGGSYQSSTGRNDVVPGGRSNR